MKQWKPIMLPNLSDLLNYRNPLVIRRFKKNFPELESKAEALFDDMLKYLWLSRKHELDKQDPLNESIGNFSCVMHREMRNIDEMWHTFILITQDYATFCYKYFGAFIHHIPEVGGDAENAIAIEADTFEHELRLFLSYTYDHLGEETVRSWFSEYA